MCGILFTNIDSISENNFKRALGLMEHRGPDADGFFKNKNFKFGHKRLKILDMDKRSNQPFLSDDQRYVIVYNGEIYNFKELAKEYKIETKTTSDTEILIELYAKLGPSMLNFLNGMFSMVIMDTKTSEVFIARDRLGIKPLYMFEVDKKIIIASEIAPIINLTNKNNIDKIGLRQYRKLRTFFNGRTIYSHIKMFPAAHYRLNEKMKRYWELPISPQLPPNDEELEQLIKSAVQYRCISDVPVGSYLSGGLDSTIVAALASKPHTWTVGFKNNNEFEWGRLAANMLNTSHSEIIIDTDEFIEIAKSMIAKRKEPLSVPNEVLLYKMTKKVKEKNTVILSGEGADELFFGYDRIFRWANDSQWNIETFSKLYSYGSNIDIEIVEDAIEPFLKYGRTIDIVAAFFQVAHLHGLLRRLDNSTMLCSVEARVPFVDHRLIERMAGVDFHYRMNNVVKIPLKRIFGNLIPKEIINRPKIGFPVPLEQIDFGPQKTNTTTAFDKWLNFNLTELNLS